MQKAVELKEMGNVFYKTKDYKKALGKYTLVQAYTRSIIPPDDKEAAAEIDCLKQLLNHPTDKRTLSSKQT